MQPHDKELKEERHSLLQTLEELLEGPMIFLGFLWLILLIIEFTWGLTPTLEFMSLGIWIIFIIDFLLKLILAPQKIFFLRKNWLTIISLVVPAFRVLKFFRFFKVVRGLRTLRLVKIVGSLNRGMKSLGKTISRRGLKYVLVFTLIVIFAGAAGMLAFENEHGLKSYPEALWWTAMLITSIASEYWPQTGEGKALCLLLSIYGLCVFGYITATLASYFIGRDAEEKDAPVAGSADVQELKAEVMRLSRAIENLTKNPKGI
ncbi:MAG: ion transporter [Ferruginibacter sp.]